MNHLPKYGILALACVICGCFGATPREDLSISRIEVPGVSEIEAPQMSWGVFIQADVVEGNASYLKQELDLECRDHVVEMPFPLSGVSATQVTIDAQEVGFFRDCLVNDPITTTVCSPAVLSHLGQSAMIHIEDPTNLGNDYGFCFRGDSSGNDIALDIGMPALETSVLIPDGGAVAILLPGCSGDSMDAVLVLVHAEIRPLH